jgi:hypothetical protein
LAICSLQNLSQPSFQPVIFNEIAWMGTANSASDEWIELKNISGSQIDLTNWQVSDKEKQIKIVFAAGKIASGGFFLLERTNDETIPGKTADLIYTGSLANSDEVLYLFDGSCRLQDEIIANPDWPAGDNSTKKTMERKSDLTWQTSRDIGGTPKSENSSGPVYVGYSGGEPALAPVPRLLRVLRLLPRRVLAQVPVPWLVHHPARRLLRALVLLRVPVPIPKS